MSYLFSKANHYRLIEGFFDSKKDFIVLGLCGKTGSGSTTVANILQKSFEQLNLPVPADNLSNSIEDHEYRLLYTYAKVHWRPFYRIKTSALITAHVLNESMDLFLKFLYEFLLTSQEQRLQEALIFSFKISAFDKSEVLPLIQKAIPSVIQQSIPAISTTFLTALVSTYSVTAIAAYGVTGKLETILFYPAMALNMVLTTIIGQCVGGARYDRAKDYLKCALGYGCGLLVILSVLVVGFSKQLSGLFVKSDAVAAIVGTYFMIVSIGYILNTVTNCFLGALKGDWILSVDADELMDEKSMRILRKKLLESQNEDAYILPCNQYYGDGKWATWYLARVFRNTSSVKFDSAIHGSVTKSVTKPFTYCPAIIHHMDGIVNSHRRQQKREKYPFNKEAD